MKNDEKIDKILEKVHENESKGLTRANVTLLRTAVQEFPNNYKLLSSLEHNLFSLQNRTTDEIKESISICERIVEDAPDSEMRYTALQSLAFSYNKLGEKQRALDIANKLPGIHVTSTMILPAILEGEERLSFILNNISMFHDSLSDDICIYARDKYTDKSNAEDMKKRIELLKKSVAIYEILHEDSDWGFGNVRLERYYDMIADAYLYIGDYDNAIVYLEKLAEVCIAFDTLPDTFIHTSLLYEGKTFNKTATFTTTSSENSSYGMLHSLTNSNLYDPIRETDKFKEIIEKLKPHAKKYD